MTHRGVDGENDDRGERWNAHGDGLICRSNDEELANPAGDEEGQPVSLYEPESRQDGEGSQLTEARAGEGRAPWRDMASPKRTS